MDNIELLPYAAALKRKIIDEQLKVWDPIRKKYLVLSPEELVRQCILAFLIDKSSISKNHISVERGLKTENKDWRYDLLLYQKGGTPLMLIECKAPSVPLTQLTFDQIANYNSVLQVPYLWISNGHNNLLCEVFWNEQKFNFLDEFPFLK